MNNFTSDYNFFPQTYTVHLLKKPQIISKNKKFVHRNVFQN